MKNVRIYKPSRTAMQSGRAKLGAWVLEYEAESARRPEPLMGWTQSEDTLNQVQLKFDNKDDAIVFAEKKGWIYTVLPVQTRKVVPRNYSQNFKYVAADE